MHDGPTDEKVSECFLPSVFLVIFELSTSAPQRRDVMEIG
jgi:hypothetical protein